MKAFEGDTVYDLPEVVMCDKKWSGDTGVDSHKQHYKAADIRACLRGTGTLESNIGKAMRVQLP